MRLHRCVPVLATVVSLAGFCAPIAEASDAMAGSGGGGAIGQLTPTAVQHHSGGSGDLLIVLGSATGIVVLGTGAAAKRRNRGGAVARSSRTRVAS